MPKKKAILQQKSMATKVTLRAKARLQKVVSMPKKATKSKATPPKEQLT
jgi:hypothetical protein